jgi:hypothetical protein
MHKNMRLLLAVAGLLVGYGFVAQIKPADQAQSVELIRVVEENKAAVTKIPLLTELQADMRWFSDVTASSTDKPYAAVTMMPVHESNLLKNLYDQGTSCYLALRYLKHLQSLDSGKLAVSMIVEAAEMQDHLVVVLNNLDDVGKLRLLWHFLVDENKLNVESAAKECLVKYPALWCKRLTPCIVAVLDADVVRRFDNLFSYDSTLGCIITAASERKAFCVAYKQAVQRYVVWLEGLVASKDEKNAVTQGLVAIKDGKSSSKID